MILPYNIQTGIRSQDLRFFQVCNRSIFWVPVSKPFRRLSGFTTMYDIYNIHDDTFLLSYDVHVLSQNEVLLNFDELAFCTGLR